MPAGPKRSKEADDRTIRMANYMLENRATTREVAKAFGMCKSLVHLHLTERLKNLNLELHQLVMNQIVFNKSIRHLRGGDATKVKWFKINYPNPFEEAKE